MSAARVKRSAGPKSKMTEATYRKKALPHLLKDFERRCAYCLDPDEFRHPSLNQVDHFNCKLRRRQRHQYVNLMLACAACNLSKHDKPVKNPFDGEQRLLNCTLEGEFPEHIAETRDGQWEPRTKAGLYHLESIGLRESCHRQKRAARRKIAEQILGLCTTAIQYQGRNPAEVHNRIMQTIVVLLGELKNFPPLVTDEGVITAMEWLQSRGVDTRTFVSAGAPEGI
jgi:hypothetical protein